MVGGAASPFNAEPFALRNSQQFLYWPLCSISDIVNFIMSLFVHSLRVDEVSSPSSKVVPTPRPRTRGVEAEERNKMAKSGGKGGAEMIAEREAGRGLKRKRAQVIIGPGP